MTGYSREELLDLNFTVLIPLEWYGPIVMNTQEELQIAFEEYRQGTFIKYKG